MKKTDTIIIQIQKFFAAVVTVSIIVELLLFPSIDNFWGCVMTAFCFLSFSVIVKNNDIILFHPFSFLAYFQMFLAHVIPLPATLLEGHPVSYGFECGGITFVLESLMFFTCSAAFYCSLWNTNKCKNSYLSSVLYRLGMFHVEKNILWALGGIGIFASVYSLINRFSTEYGDVGGKFVDGISYLQYAPLIMLFPSLSYVSINNKEKKIIVFYLLFLFVLSLISNSRQAMIYPVFTVALLFLLYMVKERSNFFDYFSPAKMFYSIVGVFVILSIFTAISDAMLATRNLRRNVNRTELFLKTVDALNNGDNENYGTNDTRTNLLMDEDDKLPAYSKGWNEKYINNFMLNRFGNMRVSDETLYYAFKIQEREQSHLMKDMLLKKILAIFPTPLLNALSIDLNKKSMEFSPGDYLYMLGSGTSRFTLGSRRVTTLVGDGFATLGYFCFPFVFVLLYLAFRLLDSLVFYENNKPLYAIMGLVCVFSFFGCFRNSIGCVNIVSFLVRSFWQRCFIYLFVVLGIKMFLFNRRSFL